MNDQFGTLLGTGKEAEVYEHGELVLKLYRSTAPKSSAFREAATLAGIEALDLPAPKVHEVRQYAGRWGLVMSRAPGLPFAQTMRDNPSLVPAVLDAMARLQLQLHQQRGRALPSLKLRLGQDIERTPLLDEASKRRLLSGLTQLPDDDRLCHGDFHPWNVLGALERPMVIDWLDARSGSPLADVCRSCVLLHHFDPQMAAAYVEAYAAVSGTAPADILAWRPFIAAARLCEGVPEEAESLLAMAAER
jgi:Ser/Thr protein kinase RdoA (MazF antagonist)